MLRARNAAGTRSVEQHLDLIDPLARDVQSVEQGRAGDDRSAVLVVVKDRDLQRTPELFLDEETFRRFDVF